MKLTPARRSQTKNGNLLEKHSPKELQEGGEDSNATITGKKGSFYESRQKVTVTKGNQRNEKSL
jgi:hypothetical protein